MLHPKHKLLLSSPCVCVCVCVYVRPCVIVLGEVSQLAGKLNDCLSILRSFTAPNKHK